MSSPPKTQNHASASSEKMRPLLDMSANHKVKRSSQAQGNGEMVADLKEAPHFPYHIMYTQERPDIVIWSDLAKRVIIVERTVSWEKNMED